ncbi:hypothetical protein J4450_06245 [Candidatus Micrarchaeota archaeon]|nr:hypothetical protein [Candidatus Micrarchaeota archaeon]
MRRLSKPAIGSWQLASGHELKANSQRLMANDPFRRFKPEPTHEVRKVKATGTELDKLRARRRMLREMTPEQALQVIEFRLERLNFFEALALAQREGKLIVPNDIHDRILTETKDGEYFEQNYKVPVWTGTLVMYERPNISFGDKLVIGWEHGKDGYSVLFTVPEQFRGKTNCALAIVHPDFDILDLGNKRYKIKLVKGANIHLIENFPKVGGSWHMRHTETGIPQSEPVEKSDEAIHLWRFNTASIGPVARDYNSFVDGKYIGLNAAPSCGYEIALF